MSTCPITNCTNTRTHTHSQRVGRERKMETIGKEKKRKRREKAEKGNSTWENLTNYESQVRKRNTAVLPNANEK